MNEEGEGGDLGSLLGRRVGSGRAEVAFVLLSRLLVLARGHACVPVKKKKKKEMRRKGEKG